MFDFNFYLCFLKSSNTNQGEFISLQKLQNRIMRTILKCRMDTPIRDMLQSLNILSVKQRVTYNTMMMLYKIEKRLLPNYLYCHSLNRVRNSHSHNTRSGDDFILLFYQISGKRQLKILSYRTAWKYTAIYDD
jgi:hypothetical protein